MCADSVVIHSRDVGTSGRRDVGTEAFRCVPACGVTMAKRVRR
jgi:hypothetical protein